MKDDSQQKAVNGTTTKFIMKIPIEKNNKIMAKEILDTLEVNKPKKQRSRSSSLSDMPQDVQNAVRKETTKMTKRRKSLETSTNSQDPSSPNPKQKFTKKGGMKL
jgi:hypothetical protein